MRLPTARDLEAIGFAPDVARRLATEFSVGEARVPQRDSNRDVQVWIQGRTALLADPAVRWDFPLHERLARLVYDHRPSEDGPPPIWVPSGDASATSNLGRLMATRGVRTYAELHRWSVEHREEFWTTILRLLGIAFRREPDHVLAPDGDVTRPVWLPGAELNIAESCFRADPGKTAIVSESEETDGLRRTTYGDLRRLCGRVASGLDALGLGRGDRVALFMPMTAESVGIYLGVVLSGRCVVGISDASAPDEFAKRARIGDAQVAFTIEGYRRDGKDLPVYEKVVRSRGPRAVVLPRPDRDRAGTQRPKDLAWEDFLGDEEQFQAIAGEPSAHTNILFSSGTTKDPKAIPWTHVTPIKCAADAYLHHDTRPTDVLAWPTSYGWMMGPWLTYASFVNRAAMALYTGAPQARAFGEFVQDAGVTMLGVVPKLVRAWKDSGVMEGLDWSHIRLFSSTAEPSTPEEMFYLMFLAGYRPIVEYCGGTEIGGGYITGTVVQPCAPGMFTTPAMGLDFVILDDGRPAPRGEVFLIPPSIGLSNELLNYDHDREYFAGIPRGPNGEVLRRHGDRIERLGGGFFRHHGRADDMINIGGVKTSAEEIRSVIAHEDVYDAKPVAIDVDGSGQHALVVYAVPRDRGAVEDDGLRQALKEHYRRSIREKISPLLAHVHDVVLVGELPQAGPGKTRTMRDLRVEYESRTRDPADR